MTKPKRMGRPPTCPATHHSEAVIVRFTPEQRETVEAAADAAGTTIGVWVREAAVTKARRKR